MNDSWQAFLQGAITALLILAATALLSVSCTRTVYIPAESSSVRSDSLAVMRWRTDTVIDRDTVTLSQSGDTITREIVKWRWRIKTARDTIIQSRADTIRIREPYPVEVVKEVPRKHPWWQTALLILAALALLPTAKKYLR